MSGPLAEWVTAHYSESGPLDELDPHARFVLTVLALAARHDGRDANLTREQIGEQTGLSLSAVSRALRKIEDAKAIAQGRRPGRGQPRARQVRIWWCDGTGCWTCDLLDAHVHPEKVVTSDTPYGYEQGSATSSGSPSAPPTPTSDWSAHDRPTNPGSGLSHHGSTRPIGTPAGLGTTRFPGTPPGHSPPLRSGSGRVFRHQATEHQHPGATRPRAMAPRHTTTRPPLPFLARSSPPASPDAAIPTALLGHLGAPHRGDLHHLARPSRTERPQPCASPAHHQSGTTKTP